MLKVIVVQPGATDFDEQRRIKGSLDLPLTENGTHQVARTVRELAGAEIDHIYSSPCRSAQQTAEALAQSRRLRIRTIDAFRNLNHGLWHGKLIDEVKRQQPRVYRLWQDHPESVCPPQGESWLAARGRAAAALQRVLRKHREGVVALIIPDPMATMVRSMLSRTQPGDLWKAECDCGQWQLIDIQSTLAVPS